MSRRPIIGAVAIGRNEGARLERCLASLAKSVDRIVYVDSGSTDGSVATAISAGAEVVSLDLTQPFTAARARNQGYARLKEITPELDFVQFIDGDCELREGWLEAALETFAPAGDLAVVCGRRRERFPEATIWNRLIDDEWDTPIGDALACGGDALMRRTALDAVGGYDARLIAGEEPEMCLRLRGAGWRIARIAVEMTWHDAALTRITQWWKRSRRAGHAFAQVSDMHSDKPEKFWQRETRRALIWGGALPLLLLISVLLAFVITPFALLAFLFYPAQIARLLARGWPLAQAVAVTAAKLPEARGVLEYYQGRLTGRHAKLIEYK